MNQQLSGPKRRKHVFGPIRQSDFTSWGAFKNSPAANWVLFVFFVVLVTGAMTLDIAPIPANLEVGSIAQWDVLADRDYDIVDERATLAQREEALNSILPIYDWDQVSSETVSEKMGAAFLEARKYLGKHRPKISSGLWLPADFEEFRKIFKDQLKIVLDDAELQVLIVNQFSPWIQNFLLDLVEGIVSRRIIEDPTSFVEHIEHGIVIRTPTSDGKFTEKTFKEVSSVLALNDARAKVRADSPQMQRLRRQTSAILASMAQKLIQPNLVFNTIETEALKTKAADDVKNILIKVQEGESVVRRGDRLNAWHITVIEGMRKQKVEAHYRYHLVGTLLAVTLLFLTLYEFARKYIKKFHAARKDLVFCGLFLLLTLLLTRLSFRIATVVPEILAIGLPVEAFYYAIPVAFGAMLVRMVLNSETATFYSIVASVLVGMIMPEHNFIYLVYFLISSIVGASTVAYVARRTTLFRSGLVTGLINLLLVVTLSLVNAISMMEIFTWGRMLWDMGFALFGGMVSAILVLMMAPVSEALFDYLTNIQLLELGSLDHPILRELIVRAPGTYHHSHMVGTLAEAACEAIGANSLFARVACYFHDIGKMKKADYFIENQKGGSRHDGLSPSMSALIIAAHVKDGLDMAKEYKLPKKIADIIPQHQGTKLISYFFVRAKEMNKEELAKIDENDYRYPGPKPQSREAGVILLADTVEAATRALSDRSPARIEQVVQTMINHNFVDGQLDETDLTLRDLHEIANTFTRTLTAIYHQRIPYPQLTDEKTDKLAKSQPIQEGVSDKGSKSSGPHLRRLEVVDRGD